MSSQYQLLEKSSKKKKKWQQILDAAKEALENNDNTKKGIIRKTAQLLENNEMPLEMICGVISREFHDFASKNYITECLDAKYKDMRQFHTKQEEVGNVTLPIDSKNVTEQEEDISKPTETAFEDNGSSNNDDVVAVIEDDNAGSTMTTTTEEFEIIRPEDYIIEDLPKYPSELKDRIIIYLDEEIKQLRRFKTEIESHR